MADRHVRTGRLGRRLLAAGLAAALLTLLGPAPTADAHAYLDHSNPADGATLTTAPRTLRLMFSEHVVLHATHLQVVDGDGHDVPVSGLRVVTRDAEDTEVPSTVVAVLPRLAQNTYRVSWETLSSDDLHRTAGILVFGVNRTVTAGVVSESVPRPEEATLRWLVLLGVALSLGSALARRVLRTVGPDEAALPGAHLGRLPLLAAVGAALGAGLLLVDQLAPGGLSTGELVTSAYGARWALRESGLLLLVLWAAGERRGWSRRTSRLLLGLGAATTSAGTALLGHAGAGPGLDLTRVLATTAHLAAATTWAGAVVCLALVLGRDASRRTGSAAAMRRVLRAFGLPAAACVSVMVVTGVYLSSDVVGSVDAAIRTFYGRSLLVKLLLVAAAGVLALVNHLRLRGRHDLDVPRRTVLMEAALAVAVVAVTAVLTSGQPATEPQLVTSTSPPTAGALDRQVEDLQEAVSLRPNRPGSNVVVTDVFDTRRPAPAPVTGVDVSLAGAPPRAATPLQDGHWTTDVSGVQPGPTRLLVTVHRNGLPDVTTTYGWTVGGTAGATRTAVVSTAPVGGLLRGLALGLGVLTALVWTVVLLGLRRRRAGRPRGGPPGTPPSAGGDAARKGGADRSGVHDRLVPVGLASPRQLVWTRCMGVLPELRNRRLGTTAALALVLALAGSTSPATRSDAAGAQEVAALSSAPVVDPQPNASLTVVDPQRYPGTAGTPVPTPEPAVRIGVAGTPVGPTVSADIGDVLLRAYRSAAAAAPASCHLPVSLLAAIGQVESGSLVGRPIDTQHRTYVLGPVLNGAGVAAIPDTDQGRWDGDPVWDRAVGPMQFIPSTWRTFGVDGDGNGVADPQDIEDASASTAAYFCYGGRDLAQPGVLRGAILSYNHSGLYLQLVTTYQQRYQQLGLDAGSTVTGLPTSISLVATPVVGRDGWQTSQLATQRTRSRAHRHATKPAAHKRHRTARPGTGGAGHHSAPFTGGTPLIQVTPGTPSTPSTPSGPGTPTIPADPSPGPTTPTGPDPGDPTGTPTGTPTDPGTPLPPADCPTAPVTPVTPVTPSPSDPSGTPSDVPTAGATTDPLCKPCDPGQTPTPDAPCDPTGPASEPTATAPTDGVTTASPSSGP